MSTWQINRRQPQRPLNLDKYISFHFYTFLNVPIYFVQTYYGYLSCRFDKANVGDLGSILGWEDPLEKGKATHSSILTWKFHGLYSPWGTKSLT